MDERTGPRQDRSPVGPSARAGRHDPSSPWPDSLFEPAGATSAVLEHPDGRRADLAHRRWHARADIADLAVLERCRGPVLDIGCGPGRLVSALVAAGRPALGIDASAAATASAQAKGAPAVHISVFGPVPSAGSWGTALLVDGNIGIGGNPAALLRRAGGLIVPGGLVLVEVESPTMPSVVVEVRVDADGRTGPWFPWSQVGASDLGALATMSGLTLVDVWHHSGRWFGQLESAGATQDEAAS